MGGFQNRPPREICNFFRPELHEKKFLDSLGGGGRRANYARDKHVYAHVGKNVTIQSRIIPIYSELISFGDNVHIARNVDFVTHDIIHVMLNRLPDNAITTSREMPGEHENIDRYRFHEHIGCIEVLDNVMIGSNSVILYGTQIGPNVIIASGSVVTKDCEPNSVYAGCPARKIGTFEAYIAKRYKQETEGLISTTDHNQHLTDDEIKRAWEMFRRKHSSAE